jgi:hypothetical protein
VQPGAKQIQDKQIDVQAPDVPNLPPAGVKPAIEVGQPGGGVLPPPPPKPVPPKPTGPSPEALAQQAVRTVIANYAAAFSRKDFNGITALFPGQPTRNDIRDAFADRGYSVEYTLRLIGDPVIAGNQARVQASRTIDGTLSNGRRSVVGPANVTVTLEQAGGRWLITSIQ